MGRGRRRRGRITGGDLHLWSHLGPDPLAHAAACLGIGGSEDGVVRIHDLKHRSNAPKELRGHCQGVTCVAFSPGDARSHHT